jgi:hypothetical protein
MDLRTDKVKTGKVTSDVTDVSKSDVEHAFLVAETGLAPGQLPMTQAGARSTRASLPSFCLSGPRRFTP